MQSETNFSAVLSRVGETYRNTMRTKFNGLSKTRPLLKSRVDLWQLEIEKKISKNMYTYAYHVYIYIYIHIYLRKKKQSVWERKEAVVSLSPYRRLCMLLWNDETFERNQKNVPTNTQDIYSLLNAVASKNLTYHPPIVVKGHNIKYTYPL